MRYATKQALIDDIRRERARLVALLDEVPASRWSEPGVWGDGWTIHDLVAHLGEWRRMFLRWYREGLAGVVPSLPAPGYTWRETPRLNRAIQERHRDRPPEAVRAELDALHREILDLVESLPEERLLEPGHFSWTGKHPLTTYLGPNTASHDRFAIQVIRRWKRGGTRGRPG
jgi:uncharacterized protein (TIGR03083 family)